MKSSLKWSALWMLTVVFGLGLILGLWLNRLPGRGADYAADGAHRPRESGEAVVMDVYQRLSPTVVNIVATRLTLTYWMEVIPQTGQGTGFLIDEQGHILTNNHVVGAAEKLEVTFAGDRTVSAVLVGRDPVSDLAVIKVTPFPGMKAAPLGVSKNLSVGQRVVAIGNPFGLQHTVTSGFISALGRDVNVGNRTLLGMIQTDAAINPGNSGGPLINTRREVIGVNTAIYTQAGGFTGIGFALPIDRAKTVAKQLIALGRVIYPWTGVKSWMDLDPDTATRMGLPPVKGVLIFEVVPGGPAALAGLRGGTRVRFLRGKPILTGGDVIVSVNGAPVSTFDEYQTVILHHNVGETVKLGVLRGAEEFTVDLTLFAAPEFAQGPGAGGRAPAGM
jgi:S1-C subfamily serine protease